MIQERKVIVIDLDGTLCKIKKEWQRYENVEPNLEVIEKLREYKEKGFYIIIHTGRNMRTFEGNIGKINAVTLKIIHKWLDKHNVPYDEIIIGKPWCGFDGFFSCHCFLIG
ncbi:HAD hydrolase family protein [Nanoarchaeota archaeon]